MYNDELEKLIGFALADGELTEKEKQILYKKAEGMGVDLDEFEMVLDARLYEMQQEAKKETISSAPKSDKLGDVKKCPACGAMLSSFSVICSDCGHEFRNIEASISAVSFFEKLNQIQSEETANSTEENKVSFGMILKWLFFWPILLPLKILSIIFGKGVRLTLVEQRKKEFVINFPIPASKEDLLEFMSLFIGRIESISIRDIFSNQAKSTIFWNSVWLGKIKQIEVKGGLSMENDKTSLSTLHRLAEKALVVQKSNFLTLYIFNGIILLCAILFFVYIICNG